MHAVGSEGAHEFDAVVNHEDRTHLAAGFQESFGERTNLFIAGVLHAQLNPATTATKRKEGRLFVGAGGSFVSDELNRQHKAM